MKSEILPPYANGFYSNAQMQTPHIWLWNMDIQHETVVQTVKHKTFSICLKVSSFIRKRKIKKNKKYWIPVLYGTLFCHDHNTIFIYNSWQV